MSFSIGYVNEGPQYGKFVVEVRQYYYDTEQEAKAAAYILKDLFNEHLDGDFGVKFDSDMGGRTTQ